MRVRWEDPKARDEISRRVATVIGERRDLAGWAPTENVAQAVSAAQQIALRWGASFLLELGRDNWWRAVFAVEEAGVRVAAGGATPCHEICEAILRLHETPLVPKEPEE
jgi:hypothetical protein